MSRGAIKKASRWACWIDVHKFLPIDELFEHLIKKEAIEIAEDGNENNHNCRCQIDEGNGIIDDGSVYSSEDEDFEGSEWVEDHDPYD
jgi:hypothetical protein